MALLVHLSFKEGEVILNEGGNHLDPTHHHSMDSYSAFLPGFPERWAITVGPWPAATSLPAASLLSSLLAAEAPQLQLPPLPSLQKAMLGSELLGPRCYANFRVKRML